MTTEEIIAAVRELICKHTGSEQDLYEALLSEAEGWNMRLDEFDYE
jgi:hypothetical protein